MSVELVTGYSGVGEDGEPNRHVSSAEDGARQAGTLGLGCYALSTGSKLSATMEDANTLVVADGDVVMNGRHVSLPDPTSFTIPTGVQGQKVSNIAVLRYSKAAASVESVTPLVLTGEPSADTPTDPAYSEGSILDGDSPVDMPLYRVITDGINAEDPEPLFDVLAPMAELRDLVSQSEPVVLFDKWMNPMNAGATLSEPVQNFFRVELQFKTNDNDTFSTTVLQPNWNTIIPASTVKAVAGGHMYVKAKSFEISNTSVETQQGGGSYACGQWDLNTGKFEFGDFITVVKVVGWR